MSIVQGEPQPRKCPSQYSRNGRDRDGHVFTRGLAMTLNVTYRGLESDFMGVLSKV